MSYTLRRRISETHICVISVIQSTRLEGSATWLPFDSLVNKMGKMGKTGKFLKPAYNDLPKPIPGVSFKKGSYLTAFISQHLLLLASALNFRQV